MKPSYPRVNELSHEGFLSLPSWSDASRCEKHCLFFQVRLQRSRGMQFSDGFDLEAIILEKVLGAGCVAGYWFSQDERLLKISLKKHQKTFGGEVISP